MPQRRVFIPEIGEVILAKRRGARNLRLSVTAKGDVRVSMPNWTPYAAGIAFAKSRADWINQHLQNYQPLLFVSGQRIGKSHRLYFIKNTSATIKSRVGPTRIDVSGSQDASDSKMQQKAAAAAERALRAEAEQLLPQRLSGLADKHGFSYSQVKIRKLTSRWGSCSQDKTISLSFYLMQLPWQLIDYVLLHELVHTRHLNHGAGFWRDFELALPNAKTLRKEMRAYKPRLEPK